MRELREHSYSARREVLGRLPAVAEICENWKNVETNLVEIVPLKLRRVAQVEFREQPMMIAKRLSCFFSKRKIRHTSSNTALPKRSLANFETLESREMFAVTYHGGALLTSVEAQAVYLGSDWNSNTTLKTQTAAIDKYLSDIVQSSYMDMMTNAGYGVGRGTASAGVVNELALNKSATLSDSSIQNYLKSMISEAKVAVPDANRLYVVYVEPGVVVSLGRSTSQNSFLGYHGAFSANGKDIRYVVLPYPGSPNPSPSSQGIANVLDELTMVTSHELAEAVTDPDVNYKAIGWYDDQLDGEIGDLTSRTTTLNGYLVQAVVDKNDQVIYPTSNTGSTLTAPLNVVATALSSTSLRISWTGASGATGYSVFRVDGSTKTLLTNVAATASSATITNLTPGGSLSLFVEAFNATTKADSSSVSITLPSSSTSVGTPQLTISQFSSTSALLSWGRISGVDGYRIYEMVGTTPVLLGTVSASATAVIASGLTPGKATQFMVEAFSGSNVTDSAWATITTTRRRR
jgi:Fibronectin type III domain